MKRALQRAAAVMTAALVCLGCPGPESSDDTFRIGVLAPKTGIMGAHGLSMEMGARVAARVLNDEGGILGRKVEIVVLDTQTDPAVTVERTKELVQRWDVQLLIGTGLSSSTLAAITPITESGVPFVYSMDGECKTCMPGNPAKLSANVWGAGFTERMIVKPFLSYMAEEVLPNGPDSRVFLLGGDYVYPRTTNEFAREVAESMGFDIVGEEYTDIATRDYAPVIRRIMDSDADLLLVTNPGDAAVAFMRQAKQFGLDDSIVISGFATFAQEAIKLMGNAAEGVYYTNRYSDTLGTDVNRRFVDVFREMYPDDPLMPGPTVAAGGFGPVIVAAHAFEKAGTTDARAFRESMTGLEVDLPQGPIRVNPNNNIFDQHMYLLQIKSQRYEVIADLGMMSHPGLEGCSVR